MPLFPPDEPCNIEAAQCHLVSATQRPYRLYVSLLVEGVVCDDSKSSARCRVYLTRLGCGGAGMYEHVTKLAPM